MSDEMKHYYVQLTGEGVSSQPIGIEAEDVSYTSGDVRFVQGDRVVAAFPKRNVAGWWEDTGQYGPEQAKHA